MKATDVNSYLRPSRCELRVWLIAHDEPQMPPGPFRELLALLGNRVEREHLESLGEGVEDLSGIGDLGERAAVTRTLLKGGGPAALYQPAFTATLELGGRVDLVGVPDFVLPGQGAHVVRDVKLARRVNEHDHPEILRQLELYGLLYEKTVGVPPARLEVLAAGKDLVEIPFQGGERAVELLEKVHRFQVAPEEPWSPVGWTKCAACGYRDRCWPPAAERGDVGLLPGVDDGLARELRRRKIANVEELTEAFTARRLAGVRRQWGRKRARVGKAAERILLSAQALRDSQPILIKQPALPRDANLVMFDLEGLPPQLDELEQVYLWGVQVFGEDGSEYQPALAGFAPTGDAEGWTAFLANAAAIFKRYGDIPFVHWASYERSKIELYIARYGDPDGVATRVLENLCDLLPLCQDAVVLPLPSYSLKAVERFVGFERTQEDFGGEWSMARFIEASETRNEALRAEIIEDILLYNHEDLKATWAVFCWLNGLGADSRPIPDSAG